MLSQHLSPVLAVRKRSLLFLVPPDDDRCRSVSVGDWAKFLDRPKGAAKRKAYVPQKLRPL